jgi:hypothetical protein
MMACYHSAPAPPVKMLHVAPRPPPKNILVYQDLTIDPPREPPSGVFADVLPVPANISLNAGGANICENASLTYVGVTRMAFTLDVPLCIPPRLLNLDGTPVDSITTAWSVSLVVYNAGLAGGIEAPRVYMQLPQQQPRGGFEFALWALDDFVWMVNDAWRRAWGLLTPDAQALVKLPPIMSIPGTTPTTAIYAFPYSVYHIDRVRPTQVYVAFNEAAKIAFAGYPVQQSALTQRLFVVPGADFFFNFQSYGGNITPLRSKPTFGDFAPLSPTTSRIALYQSVPTYLLPSVSRLLIKASLPVVQEFVGSSSLRQVVLTDMALDTSDYILGDSATKFIFDTQGVPGGVRWLRMTGGAPVSAYSVEIVTVDWQGVTRPFLLYPGNTVTMKLAFCPSYVIDGQ